MSNPSDQTQNFVIGPFTKETFNQARWKQIKDKIYFLNSTNEDEAIPDCRHFLQFLIELNSCPDYNKYFGDPSIKTYFFDEFLTSNAKNLIACKYFNNNELLEISNACLEQMALFWHKTLHEDQPKLAEMAKVILDPARTYYRYNNQENVSSSSVSGFLMEPTPEHLNWLQNLKEGDLIDCIKNDQTYRKMCWSHAKVIYIMDSYFKVAFLNDHEKTGRYIEKKANIHEIAPYKSKCHDFEWKINLNVGDELDACDTSHVWYKATVLDTREIPLDDGTNVKELFIGYRTFSPDGDRSEPDGRRYSGWSSKYDEWLSATSPRIALKGTMAKKLFLGSSNNTEDPVIDDSNDRIYSIEGKKLYALTRSPQCKSTFLVNLVNKLGELGLFERILGRIADTNNWAPIETVSMMCSIVGNLGCILHRSFAFEFVPKFKEAVWNNLLNGPEANIRNFSKDKIESVVQGFDALLKRVYTLPEKNEMIETLNLQICCVCFDSQFLERKLQGLKTLLQIIKDIRYNTSASQTKFITSHHLNNFLSRNNIFTKIFGPKGHVQLIQRSADFLKYMLHENILNLEDFQTIWNATTKGDTEAKLAVYKVLSDISLHLKDGHLDYIISKISDIPPQEVIAEEIELVFELCRFSSKPPRFIKKSRDFYWKIISDSTGGYTYSLVELTLNKFCDIMRGTELKEERISVLYDCLANIQEEVSVLSSLKIMKKLIDHYPTSPASAEKYTKSTCIEHLCKDKDLLSIIIQDLKNFKALLKKKTESNKTINEQVLDSLVGERASYITHITERLQFVHYLLSNSSSGEISLTYELLSDLWEIIVNNALVPAERDVVYKWIKEIAESKSGFPMSIEDLRKFFNEKMNGKGSQNCQYMTKEGFKCFKNVFLVINEKLQKISKVVVTQSTSSYSSLYGYGGYYYSSYNKEKEDPSKKEDDFDYTVNVFPNELEGIESIWDFILVAEEDGVAEKAIDFLNKVYLHVSGELESKIVHIREEYLFTCKNKLRETLDHHKSLSELAFTNRCVRCLRLVSSIMDESEKKGVGNLKSHSGLVKGELLSFTLINDVSTGSDVPKKCEIRLYSNTTIFDLRVEVGKQFKATWDQVKLLRRTDPKEIKDNENGRTLRELRLRNGETLTAAKRPTPPIPQATLLQADDTLNPIAKKIFLEWYYENSENGKMNPDQCAAFIHSCTNDNCKAEDKRVKDVFTTYDDDKDGFLTPENFLKFYLMACKQRPQVVWNNLHSHHYRNDLRKVTEVEQEKVEVSSLARSLIMRNDEYFHLIFSLLGYGGKIAIEAWKLLNRLPTSPEIFAEIVMLQGIREVEDKDWNLVLDLNSKYKLLYALHVIEYLMEDDEQDEEDQDEGEREMGQLLWSRNPKLLEYKKTWQADFIVYGGFEHLFKIFNIFAKKDSSKLNMFDKNILSFVLKILKNYLSAVFAATVPNIYRNLSFIKLFYLSLDFIQDYINSEHTRLSRENSFKVSSEAITDQEGRPRAPSKNQIDATKMQRKDSKAEEKKKEKLKIEETEEFRALVERLKGELGSKILSTINLKDLLEVTSSLGSNILVDSGDLESEDRMILEYSLSILMAILFYNEDYIMYFLNPEKSAENYQGADKYMLEGVFCPKIVNVRKYFSHAIYVLCRHTTHFHNAFASKYFINLFLNHLPSSNEDSKKDCNQYFELLCKLIEETYINNKRAKLTEENDKNNLNFKELLDKVIHQLRTHTSLEKRNNLNITDKILVGLLNLCEKILTVQPDLRDSLGSKGHNNLVEEIFSVCLFDVKERDPNSQEVALTDPKDYVKCKSKESRTIAYKLLTTLCKGHEANMLTLLQCMKNLTVTILKLNTKQQWGYSPSADTKSLYGYVGIKNLGCICYMNAMLQQFFMTPTFRRAVLAADDKIEPNWANKDKLVYDDNVLHQFQQMFGFLELSDRQDYNPQEFCLAFKDSAGQPVNVGVQQDAQEFLNRIFDKLENGLKQTPFQQILESVYGGKTTNQVICHGCGAISEREDIFYNLSVEVKNLKTIYDSFDKFITGETIEDYYCDTCKKTNSITKRLCLSSLPNVLIVHLQRIVFDLDTLMNQKINSRLEFPSQLNVEPYTKEGLEWREKAKKKKTTDPKKEDGGEMGSGQKLTKKINSEGTDKDKKDDEPDEVFEDEEEDFEEITENEKDGSGKKSRKLKKQEEDEVIGPFAKNPKEYYEYRLAGVVVHVGTADFGHYYSYINTNRGDASKSDGSKNDRWLEYNDSLIKDFDAKDIENECFGGAGSDSSDDYWSWGKVGREYSKNAYILVYERVIKDPVKLVVRNEEDKQFLNKVLKTESTKNPTDSIVKVEKVEVGEGENKQVLENYYCDYYKLGNHVSPRTYKTVWEDNHKFMFERHIYTDDFFKFVKEVCNTLKIPEEIQSQQIVNFVNPKHNMLSSDVKQSVNSLINILSVLTFYLLARAHDNNTITELSDKLKQFLSLNPEAAWSLFDHFVCQDLKNVLELFLNCPEKQVRSCTTQIILYAINVLISYHRLTLSPRKPKEGEAKELTQAEKVEEAILNFLDMLLSHMSTEVAKNWMKFQQYFEFWRDFSASGEPQMNYLYHKEFISILIDFYLGPKSPVPELSEKKHTVGNRYVEPEFNPLIQTVARMVQRARVATKSGAPPSTSLARQGFPVYDLSPNDSKCILCSEFYEKTLRDKFDFQSFGVIIQHFAFENEPFSYTLAELLIKGLNNSNYDDVRPYLEALSYLISVSDFLQLKRIEWIMGYPQPVISTIIQKSESFGLYGKKNLEDIVVNYETPLATDGSTATSLINFILKNRKKFENLSIICVKQLLILLDVNNTIFQYVTSLPPPSYNYAKFTDWIPAFIDYFLVEAKKYTYSTYSKEEVGLEALKLWKSVEEKVNNTVDSTKKAWEQIYSKVEGLRPNGQTEPTAEVQGEEPQKKNGALSYIFKPYIIGQTYKEEQIDKKVFTSTDVNHEVSLVTTEAQCYITESKPTGSGNLAFPEYLLSDTRIRDIEVDNDSPFSFFIQPQGVYDKGKNQIHNDVEAALKNKKPNEGKDSSSEAELCEPLLQDDNDSEDEGKQKEAEKKEEERRENKDTATEQHVEGSSGPVEVLDKDETNIKESQEEGAEASKEKKETDTNKVEENVVQERKKQVEKEDVIEIERVIASPEDFRLTYELNPVVRRFIFFNTSPYNLVCNIRIVSKTNDFMNFRVPASTFKSKVRSQSNACVLSIMKILPEVAWGDFDVECDIQKAEVIGGAKNEPDGSGRKKNVQFYIRTVDGPSGYDDKAKASEDDHYSKY